MSQALPDIYYAPGESKEREGREEKERKGRGENGEIGCIYFM